MTRKYDPDPLVIDLLLRVSVAAVAGLLARLPFEAAAALKRRLSRPNFPTRDQLGRLGQLVNGLESHIDSAMGIVSPTTKRSLGVGILLSGPDLQRYYELRDAVFSDLRAVDDLSKVLFVREVDTDAPKATEPTREFRSHVKLVEKRLREANAASTSEEALLEIKQAVVVMRRMLELVESAL